MMKKRNLAIAMAGAILAGGVAPVAAHANGNEIVDPGFSNNIVDVKLANSTGEGSTEEYNKLLQVKAELQKKWDAVKYDEETGKESKKYTFKDSEGHEIKTKEEFDKHFEECREEATAFGFTVENTTDENDVAVYNFINIKEIETPSIPATPIIVKAEIDMEENLAPSKIYDLKKAIEEKDLKVDVKVTGTGENKATYELTLSQKEGNKFTLAVVTIKNAQIIVDGEVVLPTVSDFQNHWAKSFIEKAMLNKWVVADSNFRPEASITRAEFVRIVNEAYGINNDISDKSILGFEDVNTNEWFYKDVAAAVRAGYISGYETKSIVDNEVVITKEFKPNQPITRQEAAVIIANLENGGLVDTKVDGKDKDIVTKFADDKNIASWADEAVAFLSERKIINGYEEDNTFRAENKITRAESVVMISGAVK